MTSPFVSLASNSTTCLGSQLINNNYKNNMGPFQHPKIKSDVVDKHLAKIGCTHFVKVLFTNAKKLYSTKTFLNGNTTIGCK
jgi:hypothetical protein